MGAPPPLPLAEAEPIVRRLVELRQDGASPEQIGDVLLGELVEGRAGDVFLAVAVVALLHLADPVPFILAPLLDS
jgi:hypothetical protein